MCRRPPRRRRPSSSALRPALTLLAALALPAAAAAAGIVGGVEGWVTDVEKHRPLDGVELRLSGEPLPRQRHAVTGRDGRFRFAGLPAGTYGLEARREGYVLVEQTGIRVRPGRTVTLEIETYTAFDEGEASVTGAAPLLDLTRTAAGSRFAPALFERLPLGRTSDAPARLAPAAHPGGGLPLDTPADLAVAGGEAFENRWSVDGLETTGTAGGGLVVALPPDALEGVEVTAGGFGAAHAGTPGGVIDAVTRSPGGRFHGRIFAYGRSAGMEASTPVTAGGGRDLGTDLREVGGTVGGPVRRRSLWAFLALDASRLARERSNRQGERFDERAETLSWAARLTWQGAPDHLVRLTSFGNPTDLEDEPLGDAAGRLANGGDAGAWGAGFVYHGVAGPRLFADARAGRFDETFEAHPLADVPLYEDLTPGATWVRRQGCGDPGRVGRGTSFAAGCRGGTLVREDGRGEREEIEAALTGFAGGRREHALRVGVLWRRTEVLDDGRDPGPLPGIFRDSAGTVVDPGGLDGQRWVLGDTAALLVEIEGESEWRAEEMALFAEDRLRLGPHLVLRLGVRAESLEARLGGGGPETRLDLGLGDALAPRLGLVWDVRGNGRSKLWASWGRYHDPLPPVVDGQSFAGRRRNLYTFAYPGSGALPTAADPGVLLASAATGGTAAAAADLSPTSLHEARLGYRVEILPDLVLGVSLVQRELDEALEDVSLDGGATWVLINPGGTLAADPATGAPLPEAVTLPRPRRRRRAVELELHKGLGTGFGGGWQLHGSYAYGRSEGNYGAPFPGLRGRLTPRADTRFDLPELLAGAEGDLPSDRRHRLTFQGSYLWGSRLTTGVVADLESGAPFSRLGAHPLLGRRQRFVGPRGTAGRTPTLWSVDLHADLPLEVGAATFHLVADLFNLTGRQAAVRVEEEWTFEALPATADPGEPRTNPDFGAPLEVQQPRTLRLGVRLSW